MSNRSKQQPNSESSKGRTTDSESVNRGSNPFSEAFTKGVLNALGQGDMPKTTDARLADVDDHVTLWLDELFKEVDDVAEEEDY